jgi:AcrR family transcriptional regulator
MTKSQLKTRRRAVAPQDKSERRAAIVAAAEALIRKDPAAGFVVEDIARRAGLAKGTVYLYFRSREDVLLAVHDAQMQEMFAALEAVLAQPRADVAAVREAVLGFLKRRPEFFRLSTSCHGALERSVSPAATQAHRELVAARLTSIGARIEQLYAGLQPGEGATLLKTCYAMMLGLWQLSASPLRQGGPARRTVACEPEALRIDFEQQIGEALTDLWNSAVRRGQERLT